jgi:hypothetical protein
VENHVLPDKFSSDDDERMAGKTDRMPRRLPWDRFGQESIIILCRNEAFFKGIRFLRISVPEERIGILPLFTFMISFSAKRQSCGREERALRGKSIGGKRIPYGDPLVVPQKEAGPWVIHRIAPTQIQPEDAVLALCPPGPRNGMRLMVFPRNALASWPGNA